MDTIETVLLVDGNADQAAQIERACRALGVSLSVAGTPDQAMELLAVGHADLVVAEYEALDQLRRRRPDLLAVLLADTPDGQQSIEAIKRGAIDCLVPPFRHDDLVARLQQALRAARLAQMPVPTRPRSPRTKGVRLVGQSPAMQDVYRLVGLIAPRDINVLITGESGTGKEVIAQAIHEHSPRCDKPLLAVNCAAIPETLLESELFGHEKGAFTGADSRRIGKFEQASGGMLLLDEIGDIPLSTQAKLLRVLQDQTFHRLGANEEIRCDVRIIAATHQPLEQLLETGRFRQDLYYRINVARIHLPPLREREVDVVLLAHYFLNRLNPQMGTHVRGFDPEAVAALLGHSWPGNVRELENVIRASLLMARGPVFRREFLPERIRETVMGRPRPESEAAAAATDGLSLERLVRRLMADASLRGRVGDEATGMLERTLIHAGLEHAGGHLSQAADLLGWSRTTLRKKMREYGITVRAVPSDGESATD